jgi:hypothetical protein
LNLSDAEIEAMEDGAEVQLAQIGEALIEWAETREIVSVQLT